MLLNNLGRGSENNKKDKDKILTRETVGIVLELFALLTFVIMITRSVIFGSVGLAISSFLLGSFGYCTYALLAALVYLGFVLITGKKLAVSGKTAGLCVLLFVCLVCLVHTITAAAAGIEYGGYGDYLADCYRAGSGGQEDSGFAFSTAGGVIFGLVVYPVVKLTTAIGGYIIFSLLVAASAYLLYATCRGGAQGKKKQPSPERAFVDYATSDTSGAYDWNYAPTGPEQQPYAEQPAAQAPQAYGQAAALSAQQGVQQYAEPDPVDRSKRLFSVGDEFDFKTRREMRQETRRAEEERRAAQDAMQQPQQPLSPYAQGHAILYGDRPASSYMNGFSGGYGSAPDSQASAWYNAHSSGIGSSSSSRRSSAAEVPNGNSYTSNRIFDENSYFNRRDRGAISKEQYQNYFRSEPTPLSEGHERKSRTETPAPKQEEKPASPSYTEMYQDDAESNISYSNRPKKIVTDTTKSAESSAESPAPVKDEHDYYRNDVTPESGDGLVSSRPVSSFTGAADDLSAQTSQNTSPAQASGAFGAPSEPAARPSEPFGSRGRSAPAGEQAVHIDVNDTARRAGFGSMETRSRTRPVQPQPAQPSEPKAEPRTEYRAEEPHTESRTEPFRSAPRAEEPLAAEERPEPLRGDTQGESSRNFGREETPSRSRFEPERESSRFERREPAAEPEPERPAERFSPRAERAPETPAPRLPEQDSRRAPTPGPIEEEREEEREEESALKPISDELDTAVNLFDDEEPEESSVPEAIDRVSRGREPAPAEPARRAPMPQPPAEETPRPKHIYARYNAPSLNYLRDYQNGAGALDSAEVEQNKETIVETLSNLKIPSEVVKVTQGPAVTRYDIDIPGNIPTSRVLSCDKELAMRLHAKDGVNIQTNYENGSISIEVPNKQRAIVGLKEVISCDRFVNSKPGSLMFGMGKDIEGRAICGDITKMKHLLVAGSTGSGKSVCLNALIISLLFKYSPEELRIILVDPKQVEFNIYDKLPHLMINEIINDPAKVVTVLNWAITEMERRYALFKEKTKKGTLVREIDEYNAKLTPEEEKLPKIVIIIDELADLMLVAKKDIEDRIQRLTQKSRAAGIHMVLATQRPSVNVITGVIKSNLPTRVAFRVAQEVDSRTILDESGAEKLLGNGDMLYKTDTMNFPLRTQGAFLSSEEVQAVVSYVKEHNEAYFDDSVADYINNEKSGGGIGGEGGDDSVEAVYIDALRYVVGIGQASISMIQRRCGVGYPKAGKIIEWMENMGYISAFDGAKARKVLLTQEEFESKYGDYGE